MFEQSYNPKVIHTYRGPTDHPRRRLCQRKSLVSRVFKDFETTYTCSAPAASGRSFGVCTELVGKATFETRKEEKGARGCGGNKGKDVKQLKSGGPKALRPMVFGKKHDCVYPLRRSFPIFVIASTECRNTNDRRHVIKAEA